MDNIEMLQRLANGEDPLELSIEKWEDIVKGKGEDLTALNCALCEKYQSNIPVDDYFDNACKGCPVFDATGLQFCHGSPYEEYSLYPSKKLAIKELKFLKSLRKKK